MWTIFRASTIKKLDEKELKDSRRGHLINVNEEYLCALRTKSYADFFTKAQLLVKEPPSPSCSSCHQRFSDVLLEPGQDTIAAILESASLLSKKSDLKALILKYFDISAEASKICSQLLQSTGQVQSDYKLIQGALDTIDHSSPQQRDLIMSKLSSFIIVNNPLSEIDKHHFKLIHDKYSLVLQRLRSKRRKVTRKIKLIKCFNKASEICATAACGLVAIAAIVVAAHTLAALAMGPAMLIIPIKPLKKKLRDLRFLRCGLLSKVGEQLDVAAKGTYILNREFDTMSRLVARLHDEIEHNKAMIQLCLDRREDRFSLQVLKELKKSSVGFGKQVEELEEHLYLCLVSINRARASVIKEIKTSCVDNLSK